jgi:hypothetical protein
MAMVEKSLDFVDLQSFEKAQPMHRTFRLAIFFCVQTVLFQTLYVFFVIRLANREILHFDATRRDSRQPTADSRQPTR